MRHLQDDSYRTWKVDCRVWREAWRLPFSGPGHPVSSSNGGSTDEPPAEILDCRGGARSQEVRQRILTTDEGPPRLEGHRRFGGGSDTSWSREGRINGEVSTRVHNLRPNNC